MKTKEFEKELKKALDNVNAVVKKYNPNNAYCSFCFIEDRVSANNEYWERDKGKGFDFSWHDGKLVRTLEDAEGEQKKEAKT